MSRAGIPTFHIRSDSSVLPETNAGELAKRYRRIGGKITLIVSKGQNHAG